MVLIDISYQHFISGTIAGIVSTITLYPLELIKTRMQVSNHSIDAYRSLSNGFKHVLKYEGITGLYKGMFPAIIASAGSWGGYFYLYELSKRRKLQYKYDINTNQLNVIDHLLAGTEAGVAMVLLFNPFWLIKTRLALQDADNYTIRKYNGIIDAFRTIYKEEGIRGYYKGLGAALILTSHGSIQFAVYESMKSWLKEYHKTNIYSSNQSALESMILGAISKIVASTITYPYQVIKSRLQQRQIITSDDYITSSKYHNTLDCIIKMYRKEGLLSFFRGVIPNALKVAPNAAITFLVYEETMKILKSIQKQ